MTPIRSGYKRHLMGLALLLMAVPLALADDQKPSFEQMLPRIKPLEPAEALKSFRIEKGFRVELVAAEPQITDPCAIEWDEAGRLYVCELWNYPYIPKAGEPLGRIRVLEDADGDGFYEKSTIFADNITWPSGVACWDGGVFIVSSPDILYLKDTDGDGKADVREKAFTGFRGRGYQIPNNLHWGLDNRIYCAASYAGGTIKSLEHPEMAAVNLSRNDFCFDPRTGAFSAVSGSGEWGNTFDDFGNRFICNAGTLIMHPVIPAECLGMNPHMSVPNVINTVLGGRNEIYSISQPEPWRTVRKKFWSRWVDKETGMSKGRFPPEELAERGFTTSAAGVTIYRGSAYGPEYLGNAFVGEPANNVVIRLKLEPKGPTFTAQRAGEPKQEFLASTDSWFRPVNFANGPDGCLYVVDLYREVVEDDSAIPQDILKHLDLNSGQDRGRIYRIVPENFKRPVIPKLAGVGIADLVDALDHPNSWVRETAQRLIYERRDDNATWMLRGLTTTARTSQGKIHAAHACEKGLDLTSVEALQKDPDPRVRAMVAPGTEKMADDPDPRVRFAVVLRARTIKGEDIFAISKIVQQDISDPWIRTAILLQSTDHAAVTLAQLLRAEPKPEILQLMSQLARIIGTRNEATEVEDLLVGLINSPSIPSAVKSMILTELGEGLRQSGRSLDRSIGKDEKLQAFFENAAKIATDSTKSDDERIAAIRLLAIGSYEILAKTFGRLLTGFQPPEIQRAAIKALANRAEAEVEQLLLSNWRNFGPASRADVMDAVLRRPQRVPALLDALESGKIPVGEIDQQQKQRLLKHSDATIRARAAKLFESVQNSNRQQLIDSYRAAILHLKGDATRGQKVFEANCAICHQQATAGNVGPKLGELQDRSPDTLLVSILDPNRDVKANFVNYLLVTRDGDDLSGCIVNETPTGITMRRAGGLEDTILRKNIKSLRSTGLSLMPDGMETGITQQQMADLLAYLQTYKD
ncbi:MAG TPA: PVC-type heme-binding CxxCH protein [Tepidisphaeraceae bacterium]|nr:PVC-type heme-binding CxxCH protein [Tepidisphaeraceae bacterium]